MLGFATSAAAVLWRAGGDDGDVPGRRPGTQAPLLRVKRLDRMRTAGHSAVGGVWAGFSHLMSTALARPPVREFAHKVTTADDAHQATFCVDDGYPLQVL